MSGGCERSSRSNSPSVCTNTTEAEKPPFRKALAANSASSWSSSTCSTRSWVGWNAGSLVGGMSRSCQMPGVFCCGGRLIGDQPVQAHRLDGLPELVEIDRFLDIAVGSQVVTGHQIPLFFGGGHNDHRDGSGPGVALDLFEHFHSVHFRKLQIQQHQLGGMLERSMRER